jgi:CRISPR-associated protein Cmr2
VQEFIAAARRTRDLWFGSYLLSEISRAVAKSVEADGRELIFPASSAAENVANVILAELTTGEPKEVAAQAKLAAQKRWSDFADEAYEEASRVIRPEVWNEQVDDVIEFYAAWVPATPDYKTDRQKLMRLLAGRKACRDFRPNPISVALPKSSLDGQRETVLRDGDRTAWPKKLRLSAGEQLDVVGIVKRLGCGNQPYPSVMRVAADSWVRGNKNREKFKQLKTILGQLPDDVLHRIDRERFPQFTDFPFEGIAVYKNRHPQWREETSLTEEQLRQVQQALGHLSEPSPYLAVLVADGDKMGAAISALTSAKANRAFSQALAGFADEARTIVIEHNGVLVYAGGDDVLAFLPVDQCLDCARHLRDKFVDLLKPFKNDKGQSPTLSVGLALAHCMENLEDLLEYGRTAEKAAKNVAGKDALAVHLHKRGGAPIKIATRWETTPEQRLTRYAELIQCQALPSKLPYDLKKLIEIYQADGWPETARQQAMQKDALRIVADKQPRAGRQYLPLVRNIVAALKEVSDLRQFCDELLIARQLAEAFDQAGRRPAHLVPATAEAGAWQ